MISTDPRKKAKGDLLISLNLTGSSRAMCLFEASRRTSRGSKERFGRSARDDRPQWERAARPCCSASFKPGIFADFLEAAYLKPRRGRRQFLPLGSKPLKFFPPVDFRARVTGRA